MAQVLTAPGQTCQNEQESGEPKTGESVVIFSKEQLNCLVKIASCLNPISMNMHR